MANPEHLAILKQGVETWNQWRKDFPDIFPNLSYANLGSVNLHSAYLRGADLSGTHLFSANLRGADLRYANLRDANLSSANFNEADLLSAYLRSANLSSANLDATDFSEAEFAYSILGAVDLSQAKGLESVKHNYPSTIGIDTLVRSRSNIPESFLRGAGVPEPFITNMKALIGAMDPIQFYSCFISYSTKDQDFADRLYTDLQAKGVRCWFAPHDIQGGRKIHEQIDEAIRVYDKLLLILSPYSMNSSWVKTEIANAREREEKQKQQMLFAITLVSFEQVRMWKCFDADTGIDSAREIREYFIPDFSRWKDHDSYQKAFERLLRDLQAQSARRHTLSRK